MQNLIFLLYIMVSIANAVVAADILARISFAQEPCFDCVAPRYVKLFISSSVAPFIVMVELVSIRLFTMIVYFSV